MKGVFMKKYRGFFLAMMGLLLAFSLLGCQEAGAKEEEDQVAEPYSFQSETDFQLDIAGRFDHVATEKVEDGLEGHVYRFADGDETLEISDIAFPGVEVSEALIEEEVEMGGGMEITRLDSIDLGDRGTLYGGLIHDTSMGRYVFYYRMNRGERIISFLQSRAVPYSIEEEAEFKGLLATLSFQ